MNKQKWIQSSAIFSPCEKYRYVLHRQLSENNDTTCLWIMLNPSTANAFKNDPTVARCEGFTRRWGYANLVVCNLFALRSTNPKQLYHHEDPIGLKNDSYLFEEAKNAQLIICAWGNHGKFNNRAQEVKNLLKQYKLQCLSITNQNQPKHPLYIRADVQPQEFC